MIQTFFCNPRYAENSARIEICTQFKCKKKEREEAVGCDSAETNDNATVLSGPLTRDIQSCPYLTANMYSLSTAFVRVDKRTLAGHGDEIDRI